MLFNNYTFEVVEIFKSGARVTHYHMGRKKAVMNDIEQYKKNYKKYQMVGKNGMIVWAD